MRAKPSSAGAPDGPGPAKQPEPVLAGTYETPPLSGTLTGGVPHRTVLLPGEMPGRTRRFERESWPGGRPSDLLAADIWAPGTDAVLPRELREHLLLIVWQLRAFEDAEGMDACLVRADFLDQVEAGRRALDAARRETPRPAAALLPPRTASNVGRPRSPNARYEQVAQFLLRAQRAYTMKELRAELERLSPPLVVANVSSAANRACKAHPDQLGAVRDSCGVVHYGRISLLPRS